MTHLLIILLVNHEYIALQRLEILLSSSLMFFEFYMQSTLRSNENSIKTTVFTVEYVIHIHSLFIHVRVHLHKIVLLKK